MKKALFIDRDGTIIVEPPITFQVDNLEQMQFLPKVIRNLFFIREKLDFEFAYSEVIPENIASIRLCEKLGFTFRGEKLLEGKKYFEYGKSLK